MPMTTETDAVTWTADAGVLTVVLDRPPANALGLPIVDGLQRALDAAEQTGARVLAITSAIDGFFAAGADIKLMANVDQAGFEDYGDRLRAVLNRLEAYEGISIAAIDGLALGGGLELALACTLRVGGDGARLGLPEVKLGLIPGAGGTQRLPRVVGPARALDIILTARQVDAAEALQIGLIDRLAPAGEAAVVAGALARELLASSSAAQLAVIRSVAAAGSADGHAIERDEVGRLFAGPHGQEGITAFLGKRTPSFP
ncbi:enoyl-CoA hydratase/isomerase family protein [Microbacterium aurum]